MGLVELPAFARLGVPSSAVPALLWVAGAWRVHRNPALTRSWHHWSLALVIAAGLQLYLLPFLGWWHTTAPRWYNQLNGALLTVASMAGPLLLLILARLVARRLQDHVLRIEVHLSMAAIPLILALELGLVYWTLRRLDTEGSFLEWIERIRAMPALARTGGGLLLFLPMLPVIALVWETQQRILAWMPERRCPDEET